MQYKAKQKIVLGVIALLFIGNMFVWREVFSFDGTLRALFFDVGQGDSIFIETPQKYQILIDGGPKEEVILEKLSKQMPFWDKTIDLLVLSHSDSDHLTGLLGVLEKYQIKNVLLTENGEIGQNKLKVQSLPAGLSAARQGRHGEKLKIGEIGQDRTNIEQQWDNLLLKENANIIIGTRGTKIIIDQVNGYVLSPDVLSIVGATTAQSKNTSNDRSIVLMLIFQNNKFLFTGDISAKAEKALLESGDDILADVLKVAHHGSKTSSSRDFIAAVNPGAAVISCGRGNSYGHPHQEVLSTLENFAIKILRTDLMGDIEIISDGDNLFVVK